MSLEYLFTASALGIRFKKAGDILEMHKHFEGNYHDIMLVRGEATIFGPDLAWQILLQRDVFVRLTDEQMEHEVMALEPDTLILNLYREPVKGFMANMNKGWH